MRKPSVYATSRGPNSPLNSSGGPTQGLASPRPSEHALGTTAMPALAVSNGLNEVADSRDTSGKRDITPSPDYSAPSLHGVGNIGSGMEKPFRGAESGTCSDTNARPPVSVEHESEYVSSDNLLRAKCRAQTANDLPLLRDSVCSSSDMENMEAEGRSDREITCNREDWNEPDQVLASPIPILVKVGEEVKPKNDDIA